MQPIYLNGESLTIEKLVSVARYGTKVDVSDEAWERIKTCRAMLDAKVEAREVMYGVTTGIGEFSEVVLSPEETQQFQRYLVYSHSAGIGEAMAEEVVRGMMVSRMNVHCHGHSANRPIITETFREFLNRGLTPFVCEKGSVGACGDLSPNSQVAIAMLGEGEAFVEGVRVDAAEGLKRVGMEPIIFEARDGLAAINGSNMLTAMAALAIFDAERWLKMQDIVTAMTLEALMANMKPYDERLHELRGFAGSGVSARNIMTLTKDSEILELPGKKVQDAYSMRSTPQVIGALRDALKYARKQVEIELNGVGDNPIFLPESDTVLTGANFQGTPVALPMEMVGVGMSMASVLSERRLNRLLNPALSVGLPPFLTDKPGFMSGLMLSQYTAGALCAEQRILSHPAANQSIPAAADQEDFVSMGMTTSQKVTQIIENAWGVLAIEFIAAAQAIDLRSPHKPGTGTQSAHDIIRKYVPHLDEDRPLQYDHNAIVEVLKSNELLEAVENSIGSLES